jgi:hypothetical protein
MILKPVTIVLQELHPTLERMENANILLVPPRRERWGRIAPQGGTGEGLG